ncbi:MAG: transglycosylase SLT domain-containing protein [Gammaproteobacteria bacterium]|nr:transglycosylase SLT domain-containing protein [Pseudomonadales bacterium]MCP5348906.1 transglycosylase SLT domain-containing protein [Pseudomonadales bacterium]
MIQLISLRNLPVTGTGSSHGSCPADELSTRTGRRTRPGFGVYAGILLLLSLFSLLVAPSPARAANSPCQMAANGDFLRADGRARQPWSVKVNGQPVVYVERCLIDHLLSFFPEELRFSRLGAGKSSRAMAQPAPWKTPDGRAILTLSPQSRFQLAAAIMYVESQFHPNVAPSSAGAIGAFQVLPTTGQQIGLPRVHDPGTNLQAGLKYILYIEEQIARHCEFEETGKERSMDYRNLIAASYNAGPGYLANRDSAGRACRLEAFPEFSRTEYLERFQQALGYRYLSARLRYDPAGASLPPR